MNRTYHCINCGKHFYFYGKTAKALGQLTDAKYIIEAEGFFPWHISVGWKLIEKHAKCCKDPYISIIHIGD